MADTSSHHFSFRALGCKALLRVFAAVALCMCGVGAFPSGGTAAVQVVSALSWKANLATGPFFPPCLAAVDKARGQLFIFQYPDSLVLTRSFAAYVDGQNVAGNPHVIEGVYFTEEDGNSSSRPGPAEQIAINYPNPVDRLRAKMPLKGVIAGKSTGAAHRNDAGVLLYDGDVRALAKVMQPGMPVVFTQSLEQATAGPTRATSTAAVLVQRVKDWADAWSSLSMDFFDFYDEAAYEASTESFEAFRAQKVKLFRIHEWIRNDLSDIRVLEGPGYWVTWFGQEYSDPTSCSSGVRRLYWTRDENGVFKIVGMEWVSNLRQPDAQEADYPLLPPRDAHDMPPSPVAEAGVQAFMKEGYPLDLVRKRKNEHGHVLPPRSFAFPDESAGASPFPREIDLRVVQSISQYATRTKANLDHVEKSSHGPTARPDPKAFLLANKRGGRSALTPPAKRTPVASIGDDAVSPYDAFAQELLPKSSLPENDSGTGQSAALTAQAESVAAKAESVATKAESVATKAGTGGVKAESAQAEAEAEAGDVPGEAGTAKAEDEANVAASGRESGAGAEGEVPDVSERPAATPTAAAATPAAATPAEQATPSEPASPSEPAVPVTADIPAEPAGPLPNSEAKPVSGAVPVDLSAAQAEVKRRIESWRQAWQSADVDAYMKFYADDATQGVRGSSKAIRFHKERVWPNFTPARVELADIACTVKNSEVVATMKQRYADSAGKEDYGMKTLTFELRNGVWLITREEWSKLSR
ncbi:hypothetical protein LJC46_07615 [Desulfovibrio sp. OttesenSCG-928-G15]|nr:hypothetical protein [Desulfovibrio sp. OttesenSCG-928-G15]